MQYLLMCCFEEKLWSEIPESQRDVIIQDYEKLIEDTLNYHLLECKDLDEAIAIASRIPTLRVGGSIEVRPVLAASGH